MQQLRLNTSDGEQIGAWWIAAKSGRGTVIFLHGIGGSRAMFRDLFEPLARDGYGVLAVSLRCHGDSTGESHDVGYSARHDVIAAVEFLEQHAPGGRIVICGSSFGAAAAAYASDELGPRVHGYLFDSLYSDLPSAIWHRLDYYLPWGSSHVTYAGLRMWAPVFLDTDIDQLSPRQHLARIRSDIPIVIAVGSKDFRSPPADARAMYESVAAHAEYVEFPGAEHSLLSKRDPTLYVKLLTDLLNGARANDQSPQDAASFTSKARSP